MQAQTQPKKSANSKSKPRRTPVQAQPPSPPQSRSKGTRQSPGQLPFSHTQDGGGLLHWIGTLEGRERWRNPVDRGLVGVDASGIKCGIPRSLADWQLDNQVLFTANEEYSWMLIGVALTSS